MTHTTFKGRNSLHHTRPLTASISKSFSTERAKKIILRILKVAKYQVEENRSKFRVTKVACAYIHRIGSTRPPLPATALKRAHTKTEKKVSFWKKAKISKPA